MGVGSGKACSGMQIHPRIPYLEPTSCVVQEEALESLFLSACAPSASAPPRAACPCPNGMAPLLIRFFCSFVLDFTSKLQAFFLPVLTAHFLNAG